MTYWAKEYQLCKNCKTQRFSHKARGYCNRCYSLIRRLETVQKWNLTNKNTLKGFPGDAHYSQERFQKIKSNYMQQIKQRLFYLCAREEQLNSNIDGLDIEYQLNRIANLAGTRNRKLYHGIATHIDHNFKPKQKNLLFRLLNKIEENVPTKIIDLYDVFKH